MFESTVIKIVFSPFPIELSFSQVSLKGSPSNPTRVTFTLNLETSQSITPTKVAFTTVRFSLASVALMVGRTLLTTDPILLSRGIDVAIANR